MEEATTYKLGDISTMKYGKLPPKYINEGNYPIWSGYRYVGKCNEFNCNKGDIIIVARGVGGTGDVKIAKEDCYLTNLSIQVKLDKNICQPEYFYYSYLLSNLKYLDSGSAQSQITIEDLKRLEVTLPPLEQQHKITDILKSIDEKIELNRQINDNLEQQAQNIFNHYFIDNPIELGSYSEGVLTDIAVYLNGLAMQKFRPEGSDFGLPVLKIKELGQRSCDNNSDRCSSLIKEEYIVNDGDVIFSWSGTLLVDLWCGGKCGLNQHLFKVTSDTYPKWFYYFWTKHHLDNFIRVAKDKAVTMGHIKRTELEKANIIVPTQDKLSEINRIMSPIITKIINHRIEMRKLAQLRDSLLPQLMSGELKINEIDC